ncbi:MAG: hypothetical protein H6581_18855 [Bacteroidia bacterium]|nr:hypothetical protein [Bacteroidia bacterium]
MSSFTKSWPEIEALIHAAFKNVRLGDGIGYHEAGAMDDYNPPDSPIYLAARARDERNDWTHLLHELDGTEPDPSRHCFMDVQGLLYFLPVLLLRQDWIVNSILHFCISEFYQREGYNRGTYFDLLNALTTEQKNCLYYFYLHQFETRHPDFWEEDLNAEFATGEFTMKGFDYREFLTLHFAP